MDEFLKPSSLNLVWAAKGARIKPSDEKIDEGWVVEIPHREHFNYLENKRDQALAHINQHGIPTWDYQTKYLEDKSYVQGEDGTIYRCLVSNVAQNPVSTKNYWTNAFLSLDDGGTDKAVNGYSTAVGDVNAEPNKKYYFTNPAKLFLPKNAVRGDAVIVSKSPNITIRVCTLGSGIIDTHMGFFDVVVFDIYDEVNFIFNGVNWEVV